MLTLIADSKPVRTARVLVNGHLWDYKGARTWTLSEPKRHHYLPRFYLKAWTQGESNHLHRFSWKRGRLVVDRVTTTATAWEDNLYRLRGVAREDQQFLENRFFGEIDNKAAAVIAKLRAAELDTLTQDDQHDWAVFLTSLQQRHPKYIERLRAEYRRGFNEYLDRLERDHSRRGHSDKAMGARQFIDRCAPHMLDDDPVTLLRQLIGRRDDVAAIADMKWWRLDFRECRGWLLTGDSPLTILFAGFSDPRCLLYLPLTPTTAFLAAHDTAYLDQITSLPREGLRAWLNSYIISEAYAYIYGADPAEREFIERHGTKEVSCV